MGIVSIWKSPPNFKIRTIADVRTFLDDCLQKNGTYIVDITKYACIIIRKNKYGKWTVSEKFGDLKDPFNPEFELTEEMAIKQLWKSRKFINQQFFTREI